MERKNIPVAFNPGITHPTYLTRNRLLKSISAMAPNLKGKLLDFGCGSKPYKTLFNVDEYLGLDFENPGHTHLNEQIDVFYDGKQIPFGDEHFDSVFSSEVFEHVFNLEEIIKEINRVTKKGGLLLITCPFAISEHEAPNDFARYSSFGIKHILEKAGFEILEQLKTGNSIETIAQLRATYIHENIAPYLKKIPVVRSVFRSITYSFINLWAIAAGKIFPAPTTLYLNNAVLCRKV